MGFGAHGARECGTVSLQSLSGRGQRCLVSCNRSGCSQRCCTVRGQLRSCCFQRSFVCCQRGSVSCGNISLYFGLKCIDSGPVGGDGSGVQGSCHIRFQLGLLRLNCCAIGAKERFGGCLKRLLIGMQLGSRSLHRSHIGGDGNTGDFVAFQCGNSRLERRQVIDHMGLGCGDLSGQ
jgi:hypothetical protein